MEIDITKDRSQIVDYDHCRVHIFPAFENLPPVIEVSFEGLILHFDAIADSPDESMFESSVVQLPFRCVLKFEGPLRLECALTPYSPGSVDFVHLASGAPFRIQRCWGGVTSEAHEYNMGGSCVWPAGDCELNIWSRNRATLIIDDCLIDSVNRY